MSLSFDCGTAAVTVLDASALISILGMPCAEEVFARLPSPSIAQHVRTELTRWPESKRPVTTSDWRDPPLKSLMIQPLTMNQAEYFTELVVECRLGDGEAASLALVRQRADAILVCDDAKAIRDGRIRDPSLRVISTVGILKSLHEHGAFSVDGIRKALHGSLSASRLRIHEDDLLWVSNFISLSVLAEMPSTRRLFKGRLGAADKSAL